MKRENNLKYVYIYIYICLKIHNNIYHDYLVLTIKFKLTLIN